jgi:hypothetical protein
MRLKIRKLGSEKCAIHVKKNSAIAVAGFVTRVPEVANHPIAHPMNK